MLRLRDIMTPEIVTVSPDLSLRDAMTLFAQRHISGAPVVSNRTVVGVVSLTDLVELASSLNGVPTERPDLPEDPLQDELADRTTWPDDDFSAAEFYVDLWEDSGAELPERFAATQGPEWNALEEHTVGEAMNRKLMTLTPETSVDEAAAVMRRAGVHRVLVMEGTELVGLVSTRDISDAVADHRLATHTYVFGRSAENRGRR